MPLSSPDEIAGLLSSTPAAIANPIESAAPEFRDHESHREDVEERWSDYLDENGPFEDSPIETITDYILKAFEDAKSTRTQNCIDSQIEKSRRLWRGEYTAQERAIMPKVDVWFHLSKALSNIALGFLRATLKPDEDNAIWELEPSAIPELPDFIAERAAQYAAFLVEQEAQIAQEPMTTERAEQIVQDLRTQLFESLDQQAEIQTRNLQRKVYDNMEIADFDTVFDNFLQDIVKDPIGCIKGPVVSVKQIKEWDKGRIIYPKRKYQHFENTDIADVFPSSDATTPHDGAYIIHRTQMTRRQLIDSSRMKGFVEDNIDLILKEYEYANRDWLNPMQYDIDHDHDQLSAWSDYEPVDVVEYYGLIPGHILHHAKINTWQGESVDPLEAYEMEVWVCCNKIIRSVEPPNPQGRPFHTASLFPTPHSFWGEGIPLRVEDEQRAANAALRATVRDMGYTSGPMVNVDVSLLDDDQAVPTEFHGGMVVKTNSRKRGLAGNAINIDQMPSQAAQFLNLVDKFFLNAELTTGINRQMLGQAQPGVGTLGEAQILQSNASTGLQSMLVNIDKALTDVVEMTACQIMMTTDDPSLKADARVRVNGATALLTRELNKGQLLQFLNTVFPLYQSQPSIIEPDGLVILMRDIARSYGLDPNKFVIAPSEAKQRRIELQLSQMQGGSGGGIAGGVAQAPQAQSPLAAQDSIAAPAI